MGVIAIYERDSLMRDLLREWLAAEGYAVRESNSGSDLTAPELAIVSVEAPKAEDAELVHGVRRTYPGTPIIALSGWARSGLSSNGGAARALGVERLIGK